MQLPRGFFAFIHTQLALSDTTFYNLSGLPADIAAPFVTVASHHDRITRRISAPFFNEGKNRCFDSASSVIIKNSVSDKNWQL
jgi:hypothetical protein